MLSFIDMYIFNVIKKIMFRQAWGFKNITFLDNGRVSYSNPTRQVLFNHGDCKGGGRKKAEAAADNLKQILPSAVIYYFIYLLTRLLDK